MFKPQLGLVHTKKFEASTVAEFNEFVKNNEKPLPFNPSWHAGNISQLKLKFSTGELMVRVNFSVAYPMSATIRFRQN